MNNIDEFTNIFFETQNHMLDDIKTHLDNGYITILDEQILCMIKSSNSFLKRKLDFILKNEKNKVQK